MTAIARVRLFPAKRPIQLPIVSERPVACIAALNTKMAATTIAGSLLNPESASLGSSTRVTYSATTTMTATRSDRIHSVMKSTMAAVRISRKKTCCGFSPNKLFLLVRGCGGVRVPIVRA